MLPERNKQEKDKDIEENKRNLFCKKICCKNLKTKAPTSHYFREAEAIFLGGTYIKLLQTLITPTKPIWNITYFSIP